MEAKGPDELCFIDSGIKSLHSVGLHSDLQVGKTLKTYSVCNTFSAYFMIKCQLFMLLVSILCPSL